MQNKTLITIRQIIAELLDNNTAVSRSQLAAMTGISYSRICAVINQFPEYFIENPPGELRPAVLSVDDIKIEPNVKSVKNSSKLRAKEFENNLIERFDALIEAINNSKDAESRVVESNTNTRLSKEIRAFIKMYEHFDVQLPNTFNPELLSFNVEYGGQTIIRDKDKIGLATIYLVRNAHRIIEQLEANGTNRAPGHDQVTD